MEQLCFGWKVCFIFIHLIQSIKKFHQQFFFPRLSDVVPYKWGSLGDMSMSPCCRYDILVHPNRPVVRVWRWGRVRASPDTFPLRGGRSMIKSHRCCPIGSEQVSVHVLLKDAKNEPARIRSADLSVFGLPRYHWATLS